MIQAIDFQTLVGLPKFRKKPIAAALAAKNDKTLTVLDLNIPAHCRNPADFDKSIIEYLDDQNLIDLVKLRQCEHAVLTDLEKL